MRGAGTPTGVCPRCANGLPVCSDRRPDGGRYDHNETCSVYEWADDVCADCAPYVYGDQFRVSPECRDYAHHKCQGCQGCRCHADANLFLNTATYAGRYAVPEQASRDLLAHLQSGPERLDLEQAARVVRYVIDLGWRPA